MLEHPKHKIFFIGGGINSAIGRTHVVSSQMDGKFELVGGIFSRDIEINKKSHEVYGLRNYYTIDNIEDLIELHKKNVYDCILLATPTNSHFEWLQKLIKAQIPVITEKSAVVNLSEASAIANQIFGKSIFGAVTFNYTGYPMVRLIKKLIQDETIGKIIHFRIEMPQDSYLKVDYKSGEVRLPQPWRQIDYEIPTLYLDLASHCLNLVEFLTGFNVNRVFSHFGHYSKVRDVVDFGEILLETSNNKYGIISASKGSLGQKNGLSIKIYGEEGSVFWTQEEPNYLLLSDKHSDIRKVTFGSNFPIINESRYTRFKPGHPAGFIEAFANLYWDLSEGLSFFLENGTLKGFNDIYFPTLQAAFSGIEILNAAVQSNNLGKWVDISHDS